MEDIGQVHDQISNVDTSFFLKKIFRKIYNSYLCNKPKTPSYSPGDFQKCQSGPIKVGQNPLYTEKKYLENTIQSKTGKQKS